MKKLIFIGLAIIGISGMVYASVDGDDCEGVNHLVENLNLDEARAGEVAHILSSYQQVKELAKNGQYEQIPAFIAGKQAELAEVLTEEEMQQFKENVGKWAEGKDFSKYMKFAGKSFGSQH